MEDPSGERAERTVTNRQPKKAHRSLVVPETGVTARLGPRMVHSDPRDRGRQRDPSPSTDLPEGLGPVTWDWGTTHTHWSRGTVLVDGCLMNDRLTEIANSKQG